MKEYVILYLLGLIAGFFLGAGYKNTKTEAIITRLKAEKDFYGDMSPQKHLFEKYNII